MAIAIEVSILLISSAVEEEFVADFWMNRDASLSDRNTFYRV